MTLVGYTQDRTSWFGWQVSADADALGAALRQLVTAGQVGTHVAVARQEWHATGCTRAEAVGAFASAGLPRPDALADALLEALNAYVYARSSRWRAGPVARATRADSLRRETSRPPTPEERRNAELVYADSVDLDRVTLVESGLMSLGGYARALPRHIYLPPGIMGRSPGYLKLLMHEFAHSRQYQHGASIATTLRHALGGRYSYGGEEGLRRAAAAGRRFGDFNTEQQAHICADYWQRLITGAPIAAWEPFLHEVRSARPGHEPPPA